MFEIVLYSILILIGLFGIIVSLGQMAVAPDATVRRPAMNSLLRASIMVVVAAAAMYLCVYEIAPTLIVMPISGAALILNHLLLEGYSKAEDMTE